mmetsp:Transcript_137758/g.242911  ORF Transcript_137758/g.242911 Transcript_137758/m.242911 type:complete len:297 (-) Transcript_137758:473-1363(-)
MNQLHTAAQLVVNTTGIATTLRVAPCHHGSLRLLQSQECAEVSWVHKLNTTCKLASHSPGVPASLCHAPSNHGPSILDCSPGTMIAAELHNTTRKLCRHCSRIAAAFRVAPRHHCTAFLQSGKGHVVAAMHIRHAAFQLLCHQPRITTDCWIAPCDHGSRNLQCSEGSASAVNLHHITGELVSYFCRITTTSPMAPSHDLAAGFESAESRFIAEDLCHAIVDLLCHHARITAMLPAAPSDHSIGATQDGSQLNGIRKFGGVSESLRLPQLAAAVQESGACAFPEDCRALAEWLHQL